MKLSVSWLREWVNPPLTTEQLAEQMTLAGLEVESLTPVTAPALSVESATHNPVPADAFAHSSTVQQSHREDVVLDVALTPNRADCLSLLGLAREVGVLNQLSLHEPEMVLAKVTIDAQLPIDIEAQHACPRYLARIIKNINATVTTPLWMKEKLQRCGINATGLAIVDITNYVQLELGQPLHAFDLERIEGGIVVRLARAGEQLILLNQQPIILQPDTLIIADHHKPIALAGIMGGDNSSVSHQSHSIVLESAYFNPIAIIGRARQYGLNSEAAHRFERGIDATAQHRALERTTQLLLDLCGGCAGPMIDRTAVAHLPKPKQLILRYDRLKQLLGHVIPQHRVTDILSRLGCQVQVIAAGWQLTAPVWRADLALEVDLIGEIARIYGYHNIPATPPYAALTLHKQPETILPLQRVRTLLTARGYQEAITYSFVDPAIQRLLHPQQDALLLPDPISINLSAMRLSLWPGLLCAVAYNQKRQQQHIRLFETGLRFIPNSHAEQGVAQEMMLAGVMSGNRHEAHWAFPEQSVDFFDLKGDLEALLELTGDATSIQFKPHAHPALHPGQSAAIYRHHDAIGCLGRLHPTLEQQLNLNGCTFVFEIAWDKLAACSLPKAKEISRFPANRRDIAVVVSDTVAAIDVINLCKKVAKDDLVSINLFDIYQGDSIAKGQKSLALSLLLQNTTHTAEEHEIAATVTRIVVALQQRFQASLRN